MPECEKIRRGKKKKKKKRCGEVGRRVVEAG